MKALLIILSVISFGSIAQPTSHDRWMNILNSRPDSIQQVYSPRAVLISPEGVIYKTPQQRAVFYSNFKSQVGEISSVTTIRQEAVTPGIRFEIGYFVTAANKKFMHLLVASKGKNEFVREVEVLSEFDAEPIDLEGLNKARTRWMKLCNSHQANELVRVAYASNAVYYNNNRMLVGTQAIGQEYKYMNNPSYQLTLTPLAVEAAGKDLVFELGQCSGSYQGKYTLVWKKINGDWKVLFDSN